jgi:hypothetical protein
MDMDDMAESMDDVRGGPRAISIRFGEAVAAMGGRVPSVEPPPELSVGIGSETLLRGTFGAFGGLSALLPVSQPYYRETLETEPQSQQTLGQSR